MKSNSKNSLPYPIALFLVAFLLDFLWQNAQVFLFAHYKGGPITEFILARAALFDAIIITLLVLSAYKVELVRRKPMLLLFLGVFIAILIEWVGLATARWGYTLYMPIIPFLGTGLIPTVQLGLLSYLLWRLTRHLHQKSPHDIL